MAEEDKDKQLTGLFQTLQKHFTEVKARRPGNKGFDKIVSDVSAVLETEGAFEGEKKEKAMAAHGFLTRVSAQYLSDEKLSAEFKPVINTLTQITNALHL
jgi:hypothetical protein